MIIIYKKLIFALIIVIFISTSVSALNIESVLGLRSGYSTYKINDESNSWQSLLEFPLTYNFLEIKFDSGVYGNFKSISFSYLTNINNYSNNLFRDSDWIFDIEKENPDIYAEANTKVEVSEIDFQIIINYDLIENNKNIFLGTGIGYENSSHNFMIIGPGFQRNYYNDLEIIFYAGEELLEYDLEVKSPYLLLYLDTSRFELGIKYFPYVDIYDFDHHILRDKYNEGRSIGSGLGINMEYKNQIRDNLILKTSIYYKNINTSGTQLQWFENSNVIYEVDNQIRYRHKDFRIILSYIF